MTYSKTSFKLATLVLALSCASIAMADNCGETPQPPEVIDGATATMDALVANSESVKTFISDADKYLDCRETYQKAKRFEKMSEDDKNAYMAETKVVLEQRNDIGDKFNAEVAAYKQANP